MVESKSPLSFSPLLAHIDNEVHSQYEERNEGGGGLCLIGHDTAIIYLVTGEIAEAAVGTSCKGSRIGLLVIINFLQ